MSCDFVDGKLAVARAEDMRLAGEAMTAAAHERGVAFDAVGGLVLGSGPFRSRWLPRRDATGS